MCSKHRTYPSAVSNTVRSLIELLLAYIFVQKINATNNDISPGLLSTKLLSLIVLCKLLELSGIALFPWSGH